MRYVYRLALILLFLFTWMGPSWGAVIVWQKTSTQGSCASASSCSTSFASLPFGGSGIVAAWSCWNATADCNSTSVTDNQGNSYTFSCSTDTAGNSQACLAKAFSIGSPSGTFTVTVNAAASTAFEVVAMEYTFPSAADVTKSANAASGTADTGTSAATAQADELSICVMSQSSADTNINVTTPAGYTRRGVQQNANSTIGFEASDNVLSATGTQQCAWSHDTVGMAGWAAHLVTIKAAASRARTGALYYP